ncbi:MAG: TetR/AcrR family transcriptional regulator [Rhizomicrobium sp.]
MKKRKKPSAEPSGRNAEIVEAAVRCIRRLGAGKTSVEDIASEAGVSRRTLYRLYPNRRAIMRAVIFHRLEKIAAAIQERMRNCATFEDCVVAGSIETIKIANKDDVYHSIFEEDRTLILNNPAYRTGTQVEPLFLSTWSVVFDRGRKEGKIRKGLSNHELADWLMNIHQMLEWREDLNEDEQAVLLRTFVLPSLKYGGL